MDLGEEIISQYQHPSFCVENWQWQDTNEIFKTYDEVLVNLEILNCMKTSQGQFDFDFDFVTIKVISQS